MLNKYLKGQVREWTESIIIAVILALFIRTFIIQAFKIPSGSMIPTFAIGDRIFVSKFLYGAKLPFMDYRLPAIRQPKRGDIIVFRSPETPKKDFVKRLIGMGGETVEIKDSRIYVNGEAVDVPLSIRQNHYYNSGEYGKENSPIKIPDDFYYVLGDNSANSRDSRYWGYVPKKNIIGKAVLIYWPIQRIRIIR